MAKNELRLEVLDLLARGKINIDDAARLLDESVSPDTAVDAADKKRQANAATPLAEDELVKVAVEELPPPLPSAEGGSPHWLRIRVAELDSGRSKVQVNIPFGMVRFGLGMARMFGAQSDKVDFEQLGEMMNTVGRGVLMDVEDAESNEHVRIFVE